MYYLNTDMHQRLNQERLRDCLQRADVDCLCREAGIDRRGWTARTACRAVASVGAFLVALGRRMQATDMPRVSNTPRLQRTA